ncbi:unnamed protein product [Phytophthora fragariaefolia]|uniref:Unnamed protein product n=1 Tax=Phytophthora fragariaefolia TaxID=1490495 RepID=A0A9W6Y9H5_9STRA|nr:unnamed protein product [Phytophthora fragariaefolia]
MRLVLSAGEAVFCLCAVLVALYVSPLFLDDGSSKWEFLLTWDDRDNFVDNEVIQSGLGLGNLYDMFTMTKINVYEPFGWILKAVEVQTFGLDSWRIRLVSAALHFGAATVLARASAALLNVVALLSDIKAEDQVDKEQREKNHLLGCCVSATVFAIHPVHVEVVAWPSAQPYTLCALFGNLALFTYVQARYRTLCGAFSAKKCAEEILEVCIFSGYGHIDLLCCGG